MNPNFCPCENGRSTATLTAPEPSAAEDRRLLEVKRAILRKLSLRFIQEGLNGLVNLYEKEDNPYLKQAG